MDSIDLAMIGTGGVLLWVR